MIHHHFGGYHLLEPIGRGGMAEVFRAIDTGGATGTDERRLVAVKRVLRALMSDQLAEAMFSDEVAITSKLNHPHIVSIIDQGMVRGQPYMAMEHIHGRDVRSVFRRYQLRGQTIPLGFACCITRAVCSGLAFAHNCRDDDGTPLGVVHRDVSPSNVLLSFDGDIKIIDFGIAKAAKRHTQTESGVVKGKMSYMSPEQVLELPVDHRSDIFSCGILLYELLTGMRLFIGESALAVMEKIADAKVTRANEIRPGIPVELASIAHRALCRDPDRRYQSAKAMCDDLEAFMYSRGMVVNRYGLAQWLRSL